MADLFEGPRYPQEYELDQIITIIDVVLEQYICVDPMDKLNEKFSERQMLCLEVKDLIQ